MIAPLRRASERLFEGKEYLSCNPTCPFLPLPFIRGEGKGEGWRFDPEICCGPDSPTRKWVVRSTRVHLRPPSAETS
jgi:hypothetical protein